MERYTMNLTQWIFESDLTQSKEIKAQIIEELIDALFYIHFTKKYCHDDIKSDNILVQKDGDEVHVAITDFGLSIPVERQGQMSDTWEFAMLVYHILRSGREDNSAIRSELRSFSKYKRKIL